ncbi:MAG: hypothetical protein ACR2M1_13130 [Gemmatimonadaceae bacterium]
MLSFLDALCAALLARNSIEIYRLLGLPSARKLPRSVREEAMVIAKGGPTSHMAPIRALQLYYKMSHLVDESAELDSDTDAPVDTCEPQIAFPFLMRKAS